MVKNCVGGRLIDSVLHRAVDEFRPVLFDLFFALFRDCRAQIIRFSWRITSQLHGSQHDLLLIDGMPVGFLEDRFKLFVLVAYRHFAFHVGNVIWDNFHWSWAIERHHGDHMLNRLRLHLNQVARHPATFQLKQTSCMPFTNVVVNFYIINWYIAQRQMDAVPLLNILASLCHNGQRGQPQKIHLEQPQFVDTSHVILRHRLDGQFITLAGRTMQRQVFSQRQVADDHTSCVGSNVSNTAFHATGNIDQPFVLLIGFVQVLQLGSGFQRLDQRHIFPLNRRWHQFCHPVNLHQGDVHHTSDIPDSSARSHGSKGNNLRHFISTIFLVAILHHFRAPVILKIKIDIGHRDSIRVEEAFKKEVIPKWFHRGDIECESDQRAVP